MIFTNVGLKNDTLLLTGGLFHQTIGNLQGLFFAKMDTSGNLISYDVSFDAQGGDYSINPHCTIHKMNDGSGYVIPAVSFTRSTGILCFVNNEGMFTKIVEYPDSTSLVDSYSIIIGTASGLLIFGRKQRNDYLSDIFVMKTDKQGNKLWEKYYDSLDRFWILGTVYKEHENQYLIGAGTTKPINTPTNEMDFQTIFFRIDSSGNRLWQWESAFGVTEIGPGSIQKNSAGNWMYVGGEFKISPNQVFAKNTKIVIRDTDFNLISEKIVSPPNSESSGFIDIQPTQDSNWLAIGSIATPPLWAQPNALAGWMYKFDNNLDSIWTREDTVFYNLQTFTEHKLNGVVQLPSGSIIAAGYINVYYPAPGKSWGWLLKVSKDGCIDILMCLVSAIYDWKNGQETILRVYPNPTSGLLYFDDDGETQWDRVEIINSQGQIIQILDNPTKHELNLTGLLPGIYMIRFVHNGESVIKRIFKE